MSLGILGLCSALPRLILGALSGVYVDRYDRKLLLILVNLVSAVPIAIFLAIHAFGTLAFWHLLVLEILSGSIRAINPSAAQSILAELVPREHVMNAVSLYTVGFNIARTAGPSLGGVLILLIGIDGCYAVFGVTLILAGVGMLFIHTNKEPPIKREENFLREFKEGFNYVWHEPLILSSVIAAYTFAVFIVTYQSFLPVFAKEVFKSARRSRHTASSARIGRHRLLQFPRVRWRTLEPRHAAVGHDHNDPDLSHSLLRLANLLDFGRLLTLVGAGQVCFRTISRVIIQIEAPRTLMGRVMSVFNLDQGMRSIGSIVFGAAATLFGASLGIALTAARTLIITSALFYRLLGKRE